MRGFEFLKEHEWFEDAYDNDSVGHYVVYRKYKEKTEESETEEVEQGGVIMVPLEANKNITFLFKYPNGDRVSDFEKLDQAPEWFSDFVKKTKRKYEELTRIRGLYEKK